FVTTSCVPRPSNPPRIHESKCPALLGRIPSPRGPCRLPVARRQQTRPSAVRGKGAEWRGAERGDLEGARRAGSAGKSQRVRWHGVRWRPPVRGNGDHHSAHSLPSALCLTIPATSRPPRWRRESAPRVGAQRGSAHSSKPRLLSIRAAGGAIVVSRPPLSTEG